MKNFGKLRRIWSCGLIRQAAKKFLSMGENMDIKYNESLGARVKKLRLEMNLTQAEVAKALNVTPGYISNVENNRTAMSLRMLIYYARLTHTTLDSLAGYLEPDYKEDALDNEIMGLVSKLPPENKQRLLETLKIWTS